MIYLFVIIFSFNVVSFAQEDANLNPNFYNTWVEANSYEEILNCKSPFELKFNTDLIQIYFGVSKNTILFSTLSEGVKRKYKISSYDTIHTHGLGNNEVTLYLQNDKNGIKLILKEQDKSTYFIALGEKYYSPNGIDYMLNNIFFAGNYIAESDSNKKVTFTFDGNVRGIENFNKYSVSFRGIPPVPGNEFLLSSREYEKILLEQIDKKVKNSKELHWEKNKEGIVLYNLIESKDKPGYVNTNIHNEYLTLKKVE